MVIVRTHGGLGNQLFQYAAGRRVSVLKDVPLKLDCARLARGVRLYGLDHFRIAATVATSEEVCSLLRGGPSSCGRLSRAIFRTTQKCLPPERRVVIRERHHHCAADLARASGHNYLIGYWQSERYFADIADTLRAELQFVEEPDAVNRSLLDAIASGEAVSLHIRRGDYVSDPRIMRLFGVCSVEYYQRALEAVAGRVQNPHVFVFSDDIPWAKANINFGCPTTFVDHNDPDHAHEDLRLMSRCRHHILANSSFGWWGAWLAEWPGQVVVAPRQWFVSEKHNPQDIVPERWLRV
jgi:hypothetical protein